MRSTDIPECKTRVSIVPETQSNAINKILRKGKKKELILSKSCQILQRTCQDSLVRKITRHTSLSCRLGPKLPNMIRSCGEILSLSLFQKMTPAISEGKFLLLLALMRMKVMRTLDAGHSQKGNWDNYEAIHHRF